MANSCFRLLLEIERAGGARVGETESMWRDSEKSGMLSWLCISIDGFPRGPCFQNAECKLFDPAR